MFSDGLRLTFVRINNTTLDGVVAGISDTPFSGNHNDVCEKEVRCGN